MFVYLCRINKSFETWVCSSFISFPFKININRPKKGGGKKIRYIEKKLHVIIFHNLVHLFSKCKQCGLYFFKLFSATCSKDFRSGICLSFIDRLDKQIWVTKYKIQLKNWRAREKEKKKIWCFQLHQTKNGVSVCSGNLKNIDRSVFGCYNVQVCIPNLLWFVQRVRKMME